MDCSIPSWYMSAMRTGISSRAPLSAASIVVLKDGIYRVVIEAYSGAHTRPLRPVDQLGLQ